MNIYLTFVYNCSLFDSSAVVGFTYHFDDELSLANGYTKKTAIIIDPVNLACLSFFRSVTVQCNE